MIGLLAKIEIDLPGLPNPNKAPNQLVPSLLILIVVILVVIAALVLWALFVRKPREVRSATHKTHATPPVSETPDGRLRVRKKHRRRRREHRMRNPTLAETGGLPGSGNPPHSPAD
jgi:hypothetical protein